MWRLVLVLATQFRLFFVCANLAFFLSAYLLYQYYPKNELPAHHQSFLGVAYDTLQMVFFESPIPFVDDWRLVPVFFGLPILGLLVIAEGVVNLGQLLFQQRSNSREWQQMIAATYDNHIIVAGLGNVGFRVVEQLRRYGEEVVCIEKQADAKFIHDLEQFDVPVLVGDITNSQLLKEVNVDKAKCFMALTDNDLANLEAALTAREQHPGLRTVIRMFDQRLAQKIEKAFGINCVFSTSALAAPVFAQAAISNNILASFEFGGATVNAFQLEIIANHPLTNMSIDDVRHKYEVSVIMHERNGQIDWNPPPTVNLQPGDRTLIMADDKNIHNFLG